MVHILVVHVLMVHVLVVLVVLVVHMVVVGWFQVFLRCVWFAGEGLNLKQQHPKLAAAVNVTMSVSQCLYRSTNVSHNVITIVQMSLS